MKRVAATVTPLVRFVEWLFGPRAPGIDLGLCLYAAGWLLLMIGKPELFDTGTFLGMAWLSDAVWIGLFAVVTGLHLVGLLALEWRGLRCMACLLSAWVWISVSVSFATVEVTTGVLTYAITGAGALAGALFLSGQPRKVV